MKELKRLHVQVFGHVQGVGYRHFVWKRAHGLGIQGWVRNCPDGSVEIVAEGVEATLRFMLQDVRRGPAGALVQGINEEWLPASAEFNRFLIVK